MRSKKSFKQGVAAREFHKHPFVVPVVTLLVLSFMTMIGSVILGSQTIGSDDAHVVQLSIDGKKQTLPTRATTVQDFLDRAEVTLNDGDVVEPAGDTPIDDDNFRINVYRAHPVTIFDGDKRIQALSAATTARSVAAQVGVEVYPEDNLKQESSSEVLRDQVIGDKITIDRATPVNLNLYGTPVIIRTHASTVAELLKEKNIVLASGDTVQPAPETPMTADIQVFVTRSGTQIVTTEEQIAMPIETIEDPSLSLGTKTLRQKGSAGKKLVTYQLELQNGQVVTRRVIQEVRVLEPVKEIIARGKAVSVPADKQAVMTLAGIPASDHAYVDYIMSRESGWCPTKIQGQHGNCPPFAPDTIPSGGGYGIGQATPGTKMAPFGVDWKTSVVTQLRWADSYAKARNFPPYGKGWYAAYQYWVDNKHW